MDAAADDAVDAAAAAAAAALLAPSAAAAAADASKRCRWLDMSATTHACRPTDGGPTQQRPFTIHWSSAAITAVCDVALHTQKPADLPPLICLAS